ncbi:MAG: prolyl oligopeptidase family serine peptidase [Planctomycetota bacterium]
MHLALCSLVLLASAFPSRAQEPAPARLIDGYFDARFEAAPDATADLVAELAAAGIDSAAALETALRAPRADYPDVSELIGKTSEHEVECYHVDYSSRFLLYVPPGYEHATPAPLVLVGHGGNSSMSASRAKRVAESYLAEYAPILAREMGALVVAPVSTRGWGHIGNSLLLSTLSQLKRRFAVDPDRIYATGHSMGGHMTYRAVLLLADRWAAVSPQSGGYNYVEKQAIGALQNVPGYATWGKHEPYGIRDHNRANAAWAKEHELDWIFREMDGGHEIYRDELDDVARFFLARPRDLYRDSVYLRHGGEMKFTQTWAIESWPDHTVHSDTRPLRWNALHWLEVTPRPDVEGPLTARATRDGNAIDVTANGVRELAIYLHPRMVDFELPVSVTVNGEERFRGRVEPDLGLMLDLARERDDRGRVYWARIAVPVETDREVDPRPGRR